MPIPSRVSFPDDLAFARQVAGGDPSALTTLYARYADSLFAFIYHRLDAPRSEAEEIWQETWLAALRSISSYRGRSLLFTWLCSLAQHKIADFYRKRGRQLQVFSDAPLEIIGAMVESGPLPEEILARRDVRSHVAQTLMALPDDYRTALVARYADECSVDEIARLLGKSYKATESLLARAKTAFRAAFCDKEQ
jgi:RNA polymerase sigma-70 factor (ECF subfamily)